MNAWLHTLAWTLRTLLPTYFGDYSRFKQFHLGAVNAAPAINDKAQIEIKETTDVLSVQKELGRGLRSGARSERSVNFSQNPPIVGRDGLTIEQRNDIETFDHPSNNRSPSQIKSRLLGTV